MRKFLISLLLASAAATPALAEPDDGLHRQHGSEAREQAREEHQQAREERMQAREERQQPAEAQRPSFSSPPRPEAPAQLGRPTRFDGPPAQMDRPMRVDGPSRGGFGGDPRMQGRFDAEARAQARANADRSDVDAIRAAREDRSRGDYEGRPGFDRGQVQPRGDMAARPNWSIAGRPMPNVRGPRGPLVVSDRPSPGTQPPMPSYRRPEGSTHWTGDWRRDRRYDWQDYRRQHRSTFRVGVYYDPFGWGYRPYQVGWRMWPSYYDQRYWINDPWMYRLPYAPPGYVWVRYWNDALLIDRWSGTVVDVIPGFFW